MQPKDPLTDLLQDADRAFQPAGQSRFADVFKLEQLEVVASQRNANRRKRVAMVACGMVVLTVCSATWLTDSDQTQIAKQPAQELKPQLTEAEITALHTELAELRAEAALLEESIAYFQAAQATAEAEQKLADLQREVGPAPLLTAQFAFDREVDRSAIISLNNAEGLELEHHDIAAAEIEYERVITRFPNSIWEREAGDALRRIAAM